MSLYSFDADDFELDQPPVKCSFKIAVLKTNEERISLGYPRTSLADIFCVMVKPSTEDNWFLDRDIYNQRATFSTFEDAKKYVNQRLLDIGRRNKAYIEEKCKHIERIKNLKIAEIEMEAKSRITALTLNLDTIYGLDN